MCDRSPQELAARFTARLWDSPVGDILLDLPPDIAVKIGTDLVTGLLLEVTE